METIYQKVGAVMKEVTAIDKTRENKQQGFMFRGIEDFMNELHTLFAKHGIFILPRELEHIQDTFETVKTYNGQTEKKLQFRTRVHLEFEFVSADDGSSVKADGWGEAADNGDKGYNKCKSCALKYVLMQIFLVPTKDIVDPDAETPDAVSSKSTTSPRRPGLKGKAAQPAPAPAPAPDPAPTDGASDDFYLVKQLLSECKTKDELVKLWNDWPELHDQLKSLFTARRKELGIEG